RNRRPKHTKRFPDHEGHLTRCDAPLAPTASRPPSSAEAPTPRRGAPGRPAFFLQPTCAMGRRVAGTRKESARNDGMNCQPDAEPDADSAAPSAVVVSGEESAMCDIRSVLVASLALTAAAAHAQSPYSGHGAGSVPPEVITRFSPPPVPPELSRKVQ